jgi:hypothetical protein
MVSFENVGPLYIWLIVRLVVSWVKCTLYPKSGLLVLMQFFPNSFGTLICYFWRGHKEAKGGHCLVAWDAVCRPLQLGGLEISNLKFGLGSKSQMALATKNGTTSTMVITLHSGP